jgi:hypothetical protein
MRWLCIIELEYITSYCTIEVMVEETLDCKLGTAYVLVQVTWKLRIQIYTVSTPSELG